MTREEEIKQQAIIYSEDSNNYVECSDDCGWSGSNDREYVEKGYPVTTGGDIPTFELPMQAMTELYNYKENRWIETACKWLEEEVAEYTGIDSEALKESFIEVMGS